MSTQHHAPPSLSGVPGPRGGRPWLLLGVLASTLLLLANLVAYLTYERLTARTMSRPDGSVPLARPAADERADKAVADLARQQRARGIFALQDADYRRAIANLEAAQTLDPTLPELDALLSVARKLAEAEGSSPSTQEAQRADEIAPAPAPDARGPPASATPPVEKASARVAARARVPRPSRPERRSREPEEQKRVPPRTAGVLLVTTEPDGLLVKVDGQAQDFSPVRLEVPVGRHRVSIHRGGRQLTERMVEVASDRVTLVTEDLRERQGSPASSGAGRVTDVDVEGRLDLVGLVDRSPVEVEPDRPSPSSTEASAGRSEGPPSPPPAKAAERDAVVSPVTWRAPTAGPIRVVVYRPNAPTLELARALDRAWSGAEVKVVARAADLGGVAPADAVIAPAHVLREVGLSPSLTARAGEDHVLVSFEPLPEPSGLGERTVAVLGEGARGELVEHVAGLLGAPKPPRLRRVPKTEDLLSSLQLDLADAALVRAGDLELLRRRTQRSLFERALSRPSITLAVAFVPGGRRAQVEPSIRGLGDEAKQALGVRGWEP